ncbi:MAG: type I methionyl aminopeptidase [Planctomycetaceae bacterium]
MILLKSTEQVAAILRAGQFVVDAHRLVRERIAPGVETCELADLVQEYFSAHHCEAIFQRMGGKNPFPSAISVCVNEELVGGVPSRRTLRNGDIVTIDIGCRYDGWCADAAWSYPVGTVSNQKAKLLQFGKFLLDLAVRKAGCANSWGEVIRGITEYISGSEYSVIPEFRGHGIGQNLHEDPQVSYTDLDVTGDWDFPLVKGTVFTIEPVVVSGNTSVKKGSTPWTWISSNGAAGAYFEQTVAITENGLQILTANLGSG